MLAVLPNRALVAHAVHGGIGKYLFQFVVARLERGHHRADLAAVRGIAGSAQADVLENLLGLAMGERIARGEFLAERLGAVAAARQGEIPAEELVVALPPAVLP